MNEHRPETITEDSAERRRDPRDMVRLAASVASPREPDVRGHVLNVSARGMLLMLDEHPDRRRFGPGTGVRITVTDASEMRPAPIALDAQVRWVFSYGIGVQVRAVDAAALGELRKLVSGRPDPPGP